jgi:archaellum component FlaC
VVEVEGRQGSIVSQAVIQPGQQEVSALPVGGAPVEDKSVIEESLETLKEEYDDAKLNSVIIEQVKELIEIDTNLNSKIDDLRLDLKREVEERTKLVKKVDDNYKELKEIEKSIDKFIALYELVTNQFNPFVKQDDPETRQKMQALFQEVPQAKAQAAPSPPAAPQYTISSPAAASPREADSPFIAKNGMAITNLPALIRFLEGCSPEEFSHHVTPDRNDFAAWLQYALRAPAVAAFIQPLKTKEQIVAALRTVR